MLGSHNLPIVAGRLSGNQHVARTDRVCTHCGGTAVADKLHMIHECPVHQPFRLQYAALFTPDTDTMRSFFAQQDHMQVFKLCLGFPETLLLLYAIRLVVGWLKHCNLSLSKTGRERCILKCNSYSCIGLKVVPSPLRFAGLSTEYQTGG